MHHSRYIPGNQAQRNTALDTQHCCLRHPTISHPRNRGNSSQVSLERVVPWLSSNQSASTILYSHSDWLRAGHVTNQVLGVSPSCWDPGTSEAQLPLGYSSFLWAFEPICFHKGKAHLHTSSLLQKTQKAQSVWNGMYPSLPCARLPSSSAHVLLSRHRGLLWLPQERPS